MRNCIKGRCVIWSHSLQTAYSYVSLQNICTFLWNYCIALVLWLEICVLGSISGNKTVRETDRLADRETVKITTAYTRNELCGQNDCIEESQLARELAN